MRSALVNRLGDPKPSKADRAHIKRWLAEVNDPVWAQIAANAETYGEPWLFGCVSMPTNLGSPRRTAVPTSRALRTWRKLQTGILKVAPLRLRVMSNSPTPFSP